MTDYEVDRALGYSPCVCGVINGTWHSECYRGKTRGQIDAGLRRAYANARKHLKGRAAQQADAAIARLTTPTKGD
jgi:hypothetical protein